MALFQKKTAEEQAEEAASKAHQRRDAESRRRAEQYEQAGRAFLRTPAGQARIAFERGDHVFQCSMDVMNQEAIIVNMLGGRTSKKTNEPGAILNSICLEAGTC